MNESWKFSLAILLASACSVGCEENPGTLDGVSSVGEDAMPSTSDAAGSSDDATAGDMSTGDESSADASAGSSDGADTESGGASCDAPASCLAAIDPEWSGPVQLRDGQSGDMPCAGAYDREVAILHADLQAPPATCTCACEPEGEPSCESSVQLSVYDADMCGGTHVDWEVGAACDDSVTAPAGADLSAVDFAVLGVSCEATSTEEIVPPSWGRDVALCSGPTVGECEDGGPCTAPAEPDGEICIWREGDFECPDGWDASRQLFYRDFIDERACGDCTCTEFEGVCTGYSIHLFGTNDCGEAPVGGVTPGNCGELAGQGATAARRTGVGTPQIDCSGNAEGGLPLGAAGSTSPVTACCAAP